MTKLTAIQGVLDGTYDAVRSTAMAPREYIFMDNDALYLHNVAGTNVVYTSMTDLDDVSWSEYLNNWYEQIPVTGILVFDSNGYVKRAMSYTSPNVTFDDGTTDTATNCDVLNQEEFETLYKANSLWV